MDIISELTAKEDRYACAIADKIISESRETDEWYAHFDAFAALLNHPKSLVRNRAMCILAANVQWDAADRLDLALPDFISHITDAKPITARQCIQALAQIGRTKPKYIPAIRSALRDADLSKYKDSMRPLIEKDIAKAEAMLTSSACTKRYIALLRGVNISGKNKIPMAELKKGFEALAFDDVRTYLNSGNVIFSAGKDDVEKLTNRIAAMIEAQFGLSIPVFVLSREDLEDILHHAPDWWGDENKEIYDNLIFIMPPAKFSDVYNEIGEPKEGLEKIEPYETAVFWSFRRRDYQKTNWWPKTASANISAKLTIRTANTLRKIVDM